MSSANDRAFRLLLMSLDAADPDEAGELMASLSKDMRKQVTNYYATQATIAIATPAIMMTPVSTPAPPVQPIEENWTYTGPRDMTQAFTDLNNQSFSDLLYTDNEVPSAVYTGNGGAAVNYPGTGGGNPIMQPLSVVRPGMKLTVLLTLWLIHAHTLQILLH